MGRHVYCDGTFVLMSTKISTQYFNTLKLQETRVGGHFNSCLHLSSHSAFLLQIMGCDTGHPRDFRHDSGGGGDAGYDLTGGGGGGGGHSGHFDAMPDTFHAEFITQVINGIWT